MTDKIITATEALAIMTTSISEMIEKKIKESAEIGECETTISLYSQSGMLQVMTVLETTFKPLGYGFEGTCSMTVKVWWDGE